MICVKHLPTKGIESTFVTDEGTFDERIHVFTLKYHYVRYQPFGDIYPNGKSCGEKIFRYVRLNKETR